MKFKESTDTKGCQSAKVLDGRISHLKWAFWSINIGLMAMIDFSLLPVGIAQFFASVEHGYWFARSPEIIQSDLVRTLVWNRVWGDVIFGAGGLLLGYFIFGLIKGAVGKKDLVGGTDLSTESNTA